MTQEKQLGEKVRGLRQLRNLSVEELAENSGVSKEQILAIEENKSLPSLAPLMKISRALGVRLGTFLDGETQLGPTVTRAGKTASTLRFLQSNTAHGALNFHPLAEKKSGRNMEPFLIEVAPMDELPPLSSHEGEEFLYILQGTLSVKYGNEEFSLSAGDTIYYDSIVEHAVFNATKEPCQILAVVYAPF